jgi:hypothetical protein
MTRWFRYYDEALNDPKVQLLPDALFKAWVNLMCLSSKRQGEPFSVGDIEFALRLTNTKAQAIINDLIERELLDDTDRGLVCHNWDARQFKSDVTDPTNTKRQKRFRERHSNGHDPGHHNGHATVTPTVTVTPPRAESETEQKERARARDDWPDDFREQFWELFPNKVGKQDALKALESVRKNGKVKFSQMIAALKAYAAKRDDRPWCNPATWLRQGRWDDRPPASTAPSIPGII